MSVREFGNPFGNPLGRARRSTIIQASSGSFGSESYVSNDSSNSSPVPMAYYGSIMFDRLNMKLYQYVSGSNDSGVNWTSYKFSWSVSADGVLSGFVATYMNSTSSPKDGSNAYDCMASQTYTRSNGQLLFTTGDKNLTMFTPATNTAGGTITPTTSGTYTNGGTWTAVYDYTTFPSTSVYFDLTNKRILLLTRGNNNDPMVQIKDAETGELIACYGTKISTTNYGRNRGIIQKTSWGYVLFSIHTQDNTNSSVWIFSMDNDFNMLGYTGGAGIIKRYGNSTSYIYPYDGYYDEDAMVAFVFISESYASSNGSEISSIPFRFGTNHVPEALTWTTVTTLARSTTALQNTITEQNRVVLQLAPANTGYTGSFSAVSHHAATSKYFLTMQNARTNVSALNDAALPGFNRIVLAKLSATRSDMAVCSTYTGSLDRVMAENALMYVYAIADYGDFIFIRYRLTTDASWSSTIRIMVIKRK